MFRDLRDGKVDGIEDRFGLHDATFCDLEIRPLDRQIVLRLELSPEIGRSAQRVAIHYKVEPGRVGGLSILRRPEVAEAEAVVVVLYDEFDWDAKRGCLTHSILLNGMEFVISFSVLKVSTLKKAIGSSGHLTPMELQWAAV